MIQINITRSGLDLQALPEVIREKTLPKFLNILATIAYDNIMETIPYRSGALRRSVAKQVGHDSARIGPTEPYGIYVDVGTKPHEIRHVNARALRFEVGSGVVFSKHVFHPGTRGSHFTQRALEEVAKMMMRIWEKQFKEDVI
jgi:hypothetical protein